MLIYESDQNSLEIQETLVITSSLFILNLKYQREPFLPSKGKIIVLLLVILCILQSSCENFPFVLFPIILSILRITSITLHHYIYISSGYYFQFLTLKILRVNFVYFHYSNAHVPAINQQFINTLITAVQNNQIHKLSTVYNAGIFYQGNYDS